MELEHQNTEAMYRKIIDTANDAIIIFNAETGIIIDANRKSGELLDTPVKDIVGRHYTELHPVEESEKYSAIFRECISTGKGISGMEVHVRRSDGMNVPCEISLSVVEFGEKRIVQSILRDITERRRVEEELREREERLNAILKAFDGMLYVCSQDYRIEFMNDKIIKRTGYNAVGEICYKVMHNRDSICPWCVNERVFKGETVRWEVKSPKDNRWYYVVNTPIFHPDGRVSKLSMITDITERMREKESLRESEERFRQIFEQSEDAVVIFDPVDSVVVDLNPQAQVLFGYSKEEFLRDGIELIFSQENTSRFKGMLKGLKKDDKLRMDRVEIKRRDGERIICSVRGRIIRLRKNDVIYSTFKDITDRVRIEEDRRLLQTRLIHTNKMVSMGILASGIAHEINNPNNFIMFNSQLLNDIWSDMVRILDEYFDENGEFYLGGIPFSEIKRIIPKLLLGINDGSRRIRDIVSNLKDFAKEGRRSLDSKVNCNTVVEQAVSIIKNQIRKYTERFSIRLEEGLPRVMGNPQQLEQVVINLIMNGLQALRDRNRGVYVETSFDREKGMVYIRVRDEGVGMSRDVLERITEPFFTTKMDSGGTGLGLYVSNLIVREHRGMLEFQSSPGMGTTATVKLPVVEE